MPTQPRFPWRGAEDAPEFSGAPEDLNQYFTDIEYLLESTGTKYTDQQTIQRCIYYLDYYTADLWESVPAITWNDFKSEIRNLYPGSSSSGAYRFKDLERIVSDRRRSEIATVAEMGEYLREFSRIAADLESHGRLGRTDKLRLFLEGFTGSVIERIKFRLQVTNPTHHPDDPYPVEDIRKAAEWILPTASPYTIIPPPTPTSTPEPEHISCAPSPPLLPTPRNPIKVPGTHPAPIEVPGMRPVPIEVPGMSPVSALPTAQSTPNRNSKTHRRCEGNPRPSPYLPRPDLRIQFQFPPPMNAPMLTPLVTCGTSVAEKAQRETEAEPVFREQDGEEPEKGSKESDEESTEDQEEVYAIYLNIPVDMRSPVSTVTKSKEDSGIQREKRIRESVKASAGEHHRMEGVVLSVFQIIRHAFSSFPQHGTVSTSFHQPPEFRNSNPWDPG
jgi:hypothetical protein